MQTDCWVGPGAAALRAAALRATLAQAEGQLAEEARLRGSWWSLAQC